ncbi:unnamed protein product [Rotaria sp. Silwood2]|nr:unnamed protein product [Rotaria sp. Silwood2]
MIVYRGDTITKEKLDDYCQAAGNINRYFKWLCFVSTSIDKDIAEIFGTNVIYKIDLGRYEWNDQFVDISNLSNYPSEKEILLRPGVRFRVDQVDIDENTSRAYVHIHVLPSYISTL